MLQAFQLLAAVCAALFAGAALYITLVEHPARMGLDTRAAAMQWSPSYKRATWMQAPLALLSFLSGAVVWLMGAGAGWLVAAGVHRIGCTLYPPRHHAHEPQALGPGPGSGFRRDSHAPRRLGETPRGANGTESLGHPALYVVTSGAYRRKVACLTHLLLPAQGGGAALLRLPLRARF